MKRLFDLMSAAAGLAILSPVFALVATGVLLTSGCPVFFRQRRKGRGGKDFALVKFRTMTVLSGTERGSFDAGSVSRVTPFGRFLRKTKLDELPQLWNVLKGDMALVGPRPEISQWVEAYPERWARVLTVRPGITDPASIVYRNEEEILARSADPARTYRDLILPHKLDLYENYVRTRTFFGDFKILIQTLWTVARG